MDSDSTECIANSEPWRTGQGQHRTALDPGWDPKRKACSGDVVMETDTKWWWCKGCGFIGWGSYGTKHQAPKHPEDLLRMSSQFFFERRSSQGMSRENAELQAMHLQAVVLRVAASLLPDELKGYIDKHVFPPNLV